MWIKTISDYRQAVRLGSYAWPGGYPLVAYMADGEPLCPSCLKDERRLILEAIKDNARSDQWRPVCLEVHMEGPDEQCAHCGTFIKSAYGDPELLED